MAQDECTELSAEAQAGLAASALLKKIEGDPSCKAAAERILRACDGNRVEEAALIESMEESLRATGELPIQPLSSVVEMLARSGALEETLEIDGVPYEGTIEDAFEDESVSDESTSLIYESTTDVGRIVARALSPKSRAAALFEAEPDLMEGFLVVLAECDTPTGKSTKQLESALDARGLMHRDERTNVPTMYPSMYANMLKDAGCIEWNHAWITTDAGHDALDHFASAGLAPAKE